MKYHKNIEAWITTTIFTQVLKVLDDSTGVKCGNILLFVGNCAVHPQDMSFLWHVKFVHCPQNAKVHCLPQELDVVIWLQAERDVDCSSYTSMAMSLPYLVYPAQMSCVMIVRVVAAMGKRKSEMNVTLTESC